MENDFGISSVGNNLFGGSGHNLILKGTRQCSGFKGYQGLGAENDPISVEEWNIDSLQALVGDTVGVAEYAISLISGRSIVLEHTNLDDVKQFVWNIEKERNMVLRIWRATDFNSINRNLHLSISQFNKIQAVPKKKTIPSDFVFSNVVPVLIYNSLDCIKNREGMIRTFEHTLKVIGDIPSKNILAKVFGKVKGFLNNPATIKGNRIYKWSRYMKTVLAKMNNMEDEFGQIKDHFLQMVKTPVSRAYSPNWPIERMAAYFAAQMGTYLKNHSQDMATVVVSDILNYGVDKSFGNLYAAIARNSNFYHRPKAKIQDNYTGLDQRAAYIVDQYKKTDCASKMIQNVCDILDYMEKDKMVQNSAFTKNILKAIRDRFDGHHGIRSRVDISRQAIMTRVNDFKYYKPDVYPRLLTVISNV